MWNFPLWYQDGAQKVSDSRDLNLLLAVMYKNENEVKKKKKESSSANHMVEGQMAF